MADTRKSITANDLSRFHVAKKVAGLKCWMCGNNTWTVYSDAQHPFVGINWIGPDGEILKDDGVASLILVCTNCATQWFTDYESVRKWLEENPE